MNYKYRDFCKFFFGQKDTSLCLSDFQKSRYCSELDSILQQHNIPHAVVLEQIHADIGICIDDVSTLSASSLLEYQGDFLITQKKNIALAVLTADCVPLVLVDDIHNVIAFFHDIRLANLLMARYKFQSDNGGNQCYYKKQSPETCRFFKDKNPNKNSSHSANSCPNGISSSNG